MSGRVSGRDALRYIDHVTSTLRQKTTEMNEDIGSATRRMADNRRREAEIIRQLATFRLSALRETDITQSLGSIDEKASKLLEQHESLVSQQLEVVAQLSEELSALEQSRDEQADIAAQLEDAYDKAVAETQKRLEKSDAYVAQLADVDRADNIAEKAEHKVQVAQTDRREKGVPYEKDRLFMYLWNRHFGTPDYKGSGLSKSLDGWVANLISYDKARRNYYMLLEIPKRLEEHLAVVTADAEESAQTLRKMEEQALNADGVAGARDKAQAAAKALEDIDTEIAETEERHLKAMADQAEIARGENRYYKDALNSLVNLLRRRPLHDLRSLALETPLPEDDLLVDELSELHEARELLDDQKQDEEKMTRRFRAALKDVESLRRQFKLARYDSIYSEFKDWDKVTLLVQEMVNSSAKLQSVWRRIQKAHRTRRRDSDFDIGGLTWSNGRGLPDPFRQGRHGGPFGGSWGRGGLDLGGLLEGALDIDDVFGGSMGRGRRGGRRNRPTRRRRQTRPMRFPSSRGGGRRGGGGFKTGGGF